ncbi:DH domain-containing protein [Meloidogyne graminicola]|uniref:DH domain-containing protein n=1 Tax=Meloidogyne graminicola TaxID=189291 RepID=A0A8S9Z6L8_9BILA|nr:DH domain-containing protein [Meloidogyne graminicola]
MIAPSITKVIPATFSSNNGGAAFFLNGNLLNQNQIVSSEIKENFKEKSEQEEHEIIINPNKEQLHRRCALIPDEKGELEEEYNGKRRRSEKQQSPQLHYYNRAITTAGSGLLADLQRATFAAPHFYAENTSSGYECRSKGRSSWILRRLYEWSHRAKSREIVKHVNAALEVSSNGNAVPYHSTGTDNEGGESSSESEIYFENLMNIQWEEMFNSSEINNLNEQLTERDKRRLKAVWELFHNELIFLTKQLLVLKNVYKEPLKRCQVEGCLLSVEPDLLFGNLDQLSGISKRFCRSFISLLRDVKIDGPPFNKTTQMIVQLFKRFSKGPSTISAYQAYCINYRATIEYLGTIRQKEERFVDFERICMNDSRCERLQLEDLLISPLQHITRLPILLKEILRHTETQQDKQSLEKVLEQMNENLRSIDDSVQWLHNFERLQQLQQQIVWPSVTELEPKAYIPDFLKNAVSKQFCENFVAHPRRKLLHEGHLEFIENGRTSDCYCFLFNDMFLVTKVKKFATKSKRNSNSGLNSSISSSTNCNTNGILNLNKIFIVHRQPLPLDSCVFCDTESQLDMQIQQNGIASLNNSFVVMHLTHYYQLLNIYTLQASNKREKEIWLEKFQEGIENYECIQLKDALRCTPLYHSLSLRRSSSGKSQCSTNSINIVNNNNQHMEKSPDL